MQNLYKLFGIILGRYSVYTRESERSWANTSEAGTGGVIKNSLYSIVNFFKIQNQNILRYFLIKRPNFDVLESNPSRRVQNFFDSQANFANYTNFARPNGLTLFFFINILRGAVKLSCVSLVFISIYIQNMPYL